MAIPILKRTLKGLAWLFASALTLLVVAYLTLLLINWQDEPPSAAALRLEADYRNRPAVSDADNAYVYVMGFAVAPNAEPHEAGVRRIAWLRQPPNQAQYRVGDDPVPADEKYRANRSPAVQKLSDACRLTSAECAATLAGNEAAMPAWIASEQWLLDRYLTLLRHPSWLETVPLDMPASFPSYAGVADGQRLLLAKSYVLAGQTDAAGVRKLLGEDVRFWRHVLASSDILITKMIAVAALNRSFSMGNLALRRLPAEMQLAGMPQEWATQLTDTERSLSRCFTGEWVFGEHVLRQMLGGSHSDVAGQDDRAFADELQQLALAPLFQPQDSSNRRAEMFIRASQVLQDVPFEQFTQALDQARAIFENPDADRGLLAKLYNPVGNLLLQIGSSNFSAYPARVADIEGARRAAVLATELRSRKVAVQNISAELTASRIRTPYTAEPFIWDAREQAIVFVGLEPSTRGRMALKY